MKQQCPIISPSSPSNLKLVTSPHCNCFLYAAWPHSGHWLAALITALQSLIGGSFDLHTKKTRRKIDLLPVRLRLFSETIFDHWDTSLTPSTIEESAIVTATVYASGTIARMSPAHCPLGPPSTFALRLSMVAVENFRCTASSSSTQPKLQQLASRALESI